MTNGAVRAFRKSKARVQRVVLISKCRENIRKGNLLYLKGSAIQIREMLGTLSRVESDPVGIKRLKAPSGSTVEGLSLIHI